ncbi:hypothetical protein MMC27_004663 [Xylographa pallens]|nr:hypothetical protein [Xylographa pallens]
MAILNDLEVSIFVRGKARKEYPIYGDEVEKANTITKYIQVVGGQCFVIEVSIRPSCSLECAGILFDVFIDGKHLENIILNPRKHKNGTIDGVLKGCNRKWTLEKFKFTQIVTTEQTGQRMVKGLAVMVENIGKIEVVAHRISVSPNDTPQDIGQSEGGTPEDHGCNRHGRPFQCHTAIPEKALKGSAVSHRASLAKPIRVNRGPEYWNNVEKMDTKDEPFARFEFRYRSRSKHSEVKPRDTRLTRYTEALQDLLIIRRRLLSYERPVEQLSRRELIEIAKQSREVGIKPEPGTEVGVKRERSPEYDEILASARDVKIRKIEEQEVIDLEEENETHEQQVIELEDDTEIEQQEMSGSEDDDDLYSSDW